MPASVTNPVPAGFDGLPVLDLRNPDFTVEGNQLLAELRTKGSLCRVEPLGYLGFLRWGDCDAILRDFRTFSVAFAHSQPVPGAEEETKIDTLLREDPPKHTRVRALMQQAFTPERVAAMEPHTREITRKLIDDILAHGNECEFVHQFTLPLPSTVMSGLLGVDASMMGTFSRWANSMMGGNTAHAIEDEAERQKRYEELARDAKDMEAFLKERMEEHRKSPQQDLITYLLQAAEGGDRLTDREVLTLIKLCIIAGNDLTTQALALTLDCLLENPGQMRLLANDLSLAANAFEESLRYNGPVVTLQRKALRDVEIAGVKVSAGCVVAPVVSSANHDEAVFENPEVFDIRRTIPRVLSMSSGNHQCIGQPLARLEARVAFEEWFARVMSFTRKGSPQFTKQMGLRGFDQLPVVMEPRPAKAAAPAPEDSVVKQAATAEKLAAMSDQQLGLDKRQIMSVRVAQIWQVSTTTKVFALTHPTGGLLPKFTPGKHIVVHMRDGGKVFRNSYSLINGGYNTGLGYFIGVQLATNSKGGSKYMHEKVARGGELTISVPANCFPAAESAVKHLLIAGGIGITPLLAHRTHLK
ncbi:MAG: cytochrome P450, partial [Methylocella sp.]